MDVYTIGVQIVAVAIILVFLFIIFNVVRSYYRVRRIKKFTIDNKNYNETAEVILLNVVKKISAFLNSLLIFKSVVCVYDKYLEYRDTKVSSMDILSIKFLLVIVMLFLYSLSIALYKSVFSIYLVFLLSVIVFFLPDIFLLVTDKIKYQNLDELRIILVMNNALKANKSLEQALEQALARSDGRTRIELEKVKKDIKNGLTIGEAFFRFYTRTGSGKIKRIAETLSAVQVSGANVIAAFALLEEDFTKDEMCNTECKSLRKVNSTISVFLVFVPFVILYFVKETTDLWNRSLSCGQQKYLFVLLGILYLVYIVFLRIIGGSNSDER